MTTLLLYTSNFVYGMDQQKKASLRKAQELLTLVQLNERQLLAAMAACQTTTNELSELPHEIQITTPELLQEYNRSLNAVSEKQQIASALIEQLIKDMIVIKEEVSKIERSLDTAESKSSEQ